MRVMALALASILAVFVADNQAFAAKRGTSIANLDGPYYAQRCQGSNAYCYRSGSQKNPKKKH
jgi:hypothetical protein